MAKRKRRANRKRKDGEKLSISELNVILQEIMEQAEGQYKEWRA